MRLCFLTRHDLRNKWSWSGKLRSMYRALCEQDIELTHVGDQLITRGPTGFCHPCTIQREKGRTHRANENTPWTPDFQATVETGFAPACAVMLAGILRSFLWQAKGHGLNNWECHRAFAKALLHFLLGVRGKGGTPPTAKTPSPRKASA